MDTAAYFWRPPAVVPENSDPRDHGVVSEPRFFTDEDLLEDCPAVSPSGRRYFPFPPRRMQRPFVAPVPAPVRAPVRVTPPSDWDDGTTAMQTSPPSPVEDDFVTVPFICKICEQRFDTIPRRAHERFCTGIMPEGQKSPFPCQKCKLYFHTGPARDLHELSCEEPRGK